MKMLQEFWKEEEGITTVEILLVLAVLVIIAIIFKDAIVKWVTDTVAKVFNNADKIYETPIPEPPATET